MQRDIVKFDIDVPKTVRLDFAEGKEVKTRSGAKQWQYTLNSDQAIMWLPLAGRQAIERSGAQAGDEVRIVKTYMGQQTVFTAQVVQEAPPMPAQLATPALVRNGNGKHLPARVFYQPEGAPEPAARPSAPGTAQPIAQVHPMEELLTRCLVVAGRSTHNARCILIEEGYPAPQALWDDVRAAGISLFINRSNGGK